VRGARALLQARADSGRARSRARGALPRAVAAAPRCGAAAAPHGLTVGRQRQREWVAELRLRAALGRLDEAEPCALQRGTASQSVPTDSATSSAA